MDLNTEETEKLLRTMMSDCQRTAETMQERLEQVVAHLRDGQHLAVLGAFTGLDEAALYISVVLKRLSHVTRTAR